MNTRTTIPKQAQGLSPDEVKDPLAGLVAAANAKDDMAFLTAYEQISWPDQTAVNFARAVHLALTAGAHILARDLAQEGTDLYPNHAELLVGRNYLFGVCGMRVIYTVFMSILRPIQGLI